MNRSRIRIFYFLAIALLLSLYLVSLSSNIPPPASEISYSAFKERVSAGEVAEVIFHDHQLEIILLEGRTMPDGSVAPRRLTVEVPDVDDPALWPLLEKHGVVVTSEPAADGSASDWLFGLLPWILLIGFYLWFWNRMYKNAAGRFGGRDVSDFLQGSAAREERGRPKVTFDDVAGQENAKAEVAELVDFLKDPAQYRRMGAEPPKGVLLMGPPGTGKTLLARALAGEAGVAFFSISASEFIEMFVGVGASRVRRMFEEARKRAPSIIFIDELDAVGRMRGTGFGGGHDEREQTLNQILAEMDGFTGHEAVIVLAATNRPDVLDPALLRPGRFDRHVTLELPDREAREAILKVHTRKIPLADDVDLKNVAAGTPGFSGADLKNLANEAAMAAARAGSENVSHQQFDDMRDKLMMGTVRTLAIQPKEQHRLAVHEAGHTIVAHFRPHADPLYKVTIIPRGRALGATHMLPEEERHTLPAEYLEDRLAVMLGGYAAEGAILGTVSSGADDDISQATKLARAMVARWGMSEAIGPMDLRQSEDHPFLGREIAQPRHFSEATTRLVDKAVQEMLGEARQRAGDIITSHRAKVERLIAELETRETLNYNEIVACLGPVEGEPSVKLVP